MINEKKEFIKLNGKADIHVITARLLPLID